MLDINDNYSLAMSLQELKTERESLVDFMNEFRMAEQRVT